MSQSHEGFRGSIAELLGDKPSAENADKKRGSFLGWDWKEPFKFAALYC